MQVSGYRSMWLMAMFDLPVDTKAARKRYAQFVKALKKFGFERMQYSVYFRHCASQESAEFQENRLAVAVPQYGEVRTMAVTDKQFERMKVYLGKKRVEPEQAPAQLELF